ncbi:MAG: hypothetical protein AAFV53_27515 [Myxococcota bacterium]
MMLALLCSVGMAGTFEVTLDAARDAMLEDDLKLAAGYIRAAELYAPQAPTPIPSDELGRIWLYRGMILYKQNADDAQEAMSQWRQALAINTDLEWDRQALENNDARGLFEALRREVRDRPKVDPKAPEKIGAANLFVDGNDLSDEPVIIEGVHLAQVECPDEQGTFGEWTEFEKPARWLQLCPEGVDTSVVVEEEEPEDEFADFGPVFGSGPGEVDNTVYEPLSPVDPISRKKVNVPLLASAGAAAVVAGGMYLAALSSRNQYDDLNNTNAQTIQDLEDLRSQTNNRVYISAGAGVVAVGLYTAAFINF